MRIDVLAVTKEIEKANLSEQKLLGGKLAGICYMQGDFYDKQIQDKALQRANFTIKNGHHSVFDHGNITVLFKGIPKIVAMILNNTRYYTTSEKSARYTEMGPKTDIEIKLYDKWTKILKEKIIEVYSNINKEYAHKLAQENARYMISVFTPTVMAYTTSFRQWNYIIDWTKKFVLSINDIDGAFNKRLLMHMAELKMSLEKIFGKEIITDNKNRHFTLLPIQMGYTKDEFDQRNNIISDVYSVHYLSSFASLAQAQRHRTISYKAIFSGNNPTEYGYYTPRLLFDYPELQKEWQKDMDSVAHVYPQGILLKVTEQGLAEDFLKKCEKRLCGRTQLETMLNTLEIFKSFSKNRDKLSPYNRNTLETMVTTKGFVPRCGFKGFKCTEPCRWGIKEGLTRMI